jgi:formylglycine-generating enzyme required for sulfatase activity
MGYKRDLLKLGQIPSMQLPVSLGKYEITELLHRGAIEVYRGREISTEQPVTVQVAGADATARERLLQIARVMGKARHESIARVLKIGEFEGRPYALTEELEPADLSNIGGARERLRAGAKIAGALSYFESNRVPIGDIRADDVYVDPDGHIKLVNAGTPGPIGAIPSFGALLTSLLEHTEEVPGPARQLANQCTAPSAEDRPRNFGEISRRLQAMLAPQVVRQPRNPGKSLVNLSIYVYGAVLAVTVLAIITWYWYQPAKEISGMVYIPAGNFLAGEDKHSVTLKDFYIDATEVTNAEYSDFCRVSGCAVPVEAPNLPVVNVTITEARAYAHWKHERLLTEPEWERAARGTNGALYPWGDKHDPALANVSDNPILKAHTIMPASSFGAYPAFQMAGNVWEIVDSERTPSQQDLARFSTLLTPPLTEDEPWIAVRGGSFREPLVPMYDSRAVPARYAAGDIGFRCARDP